ncbi:MAG: peptidoglycan-binding protein [Acidobacteriia bacterium]|nr:peptidoglycan-binding protein [Terriglobia bacterium]
MRRVALLCALMLLLVFISHPAEAQSKKESSNSAPKSRTPPPKVPSQKKNSSSSPQQPKGKSSNSKKKASRKKRPAKPKGQLKPDAERTREIQEKLINSGAMAGPPNGVWDSGQMGEAIRRFQQMHGLNATGKLDVKTLKAMGLKS